MPAGKKNKITPGMKKKRKKSETQFVRGSAPGGRKTEGKKKGKQFVRGSAPGGRKIKDSGDQNRREEK